MSNHILNNCRFETKNVSIKNLRKLELILLYYNDGWGTKKNTSLLSELNIQTMSHLYVKDKILWLTSDALYLPFEDLPILDIEYVLNTF